MSSARGRYARLKISYDDDSPNVIAAKQHLQFVRISEFLDRELAQQPPLSREQAEALASRLREGEA